LATSELAEKIKDFAMWEIKPLNNTEEGLQIPTISRSFTCKNFQLAMDAINSIGVICEAENHHADLHIESYRNVRIVVYTHKVKGVTGNDIELARMIDGVKVGYSPVWLKKHAEADGSQIV